MTQPVLMGTAGHIDHGKTTLVKALTGIDCDRLAEEKKRGITIELGFAFFALENGQRLSIIDVPGHERFIKNMVAGASGIDFVLLIIAADEGIMPQTREHLEICTLLGIETGLVVLTKTDMVDAPWLEMVTEDVHSFLEPTFLQGAPVIPVCAHTGQGLDALSGAIARMSQDAVSRRPADVFRLPVDRVFTMHGHGTVVTGTLVSGHVETGEEIMLYPCGKTSKVRGLQSHGETVRIATAGKRTAVNLADLEVDAIARGDVIARKDTLFPDTVWIAELSILPSAGKELKHRKEIHLHHGTREVLARIHLLDRDALRPGETALCQVRFSQAMTGLYGDRFVVRSFSPLRTIAGGRLLHPAAGTMEKRIKRFSTQDLTVLSGLASPDATEVLLTQIRLAGTHGISVTALRTRIALEGKALEKILQTLSSQGKIHLLDKEKRVYICGDCIGEQAALLLDFMQEYHSSLPMKQGIPRPELASGWGRHLPENLLHFLTERLVRQGRLVFHKQHIALPGHTVTLASDAAKLQQALVKTYKSSGITPPTVKEVTQKLELELKELAGMYELLLSKGELVKISETLYFHQQAISSLEEQMTRFLQENKQMTAPDFKTLTGLSRKYAIPVMEYFDRIKVSMRIGDVRVLRKSESS